MKHRQFALAFALLCVGSATHAQDAQAAVQPEASEQPLYTVVDGYKVDPDTLKAFAPGAPPPATAAMVPTRKAWSAPR